MTSTISQLTKEYIRELADFQPLWALSMGIKGYEGKLADLSKTRIAEHLQFIREMARKVSKIASSRLSVWDRMERELLASELKIRQKEWGSWKRYQADPSLYVGELVYGLWYLHLRVESPSLKVAASLERMKNSFQILRMAESNLRRPPRLWTRMAVEESAGYLKFLSVVEKELLGLAPRRSVEIRRAVLEATRVGEELSRFLKKELGKRSTGKFAVGERNFNFLLKTYHHYSLTADELLKIGRSQIAHVKRELESQAASLAPGVSWPRLLERVRRHHPQKSKLLQVYRRDTRFLRRFIRQKKIVSVPGDERLQVIETPVFTRNTIPYAAYVDPPMFGRRNHGTFFVTPITEKRKQVAREILEEHNYGALRVTALHEGYPGHHLQFAKQFHSPGAMMKIFNCSSFYEGWALYCEEMMYEVGCYDEATRLLQLKDKLWRACRVVVDVSLHTGRMSDSAAVRFLAREAKMSRTSARADVNWYTQRPTIPQSYFTGMLRIKQLRERCRRKWGRKFTLKKFHDAFLRYGAIPIPLVEKAIL